MAKINKFLLGINLCLLACFAYFYAFYAGDFFWRINYQKLYMECRQKTGKMLDLQTIRDYLSDDPHSYSTLNTAKEVKLLNKYSNDAEVYFEYGSGGSTFEGLKKENIRKVYSVENSRSWLDDYMYLFQFIRKNEKDGRLEMIYVDTGGTLDWGYPIDKNQDYSRYPEAFTKKTEYQEADVILVDGRYRVACMLQVLLHAKENAVILLHDVFRPAYQEVYQFFDVIEREDELSVFKVKKGADTDKAAAMYEKYKFDPR